MTADNPAALVLVFQGNDGIRQPMLGSFRARHNLNRHGSKARTEREREKKSNLLRVWHHTASMSLHANEKRYIYILFFSNSSETTNKYSKRTRKKVKEIKRVHMSFLCYVLKRVALFDSPP